MSVLHIPVSSVESCACSKCAVYTPFAHVPLYEGTVVNNERVSTHASSFSGKFAQSGCGLYLMSGDKQDAESITLSSLGTHVALCAVQSVTLRRRTLSISFSPAAASSTQIRWAALVGRLSSDLIVMVFDRAELSVSVSEDVVAVKDLHITIDNHLEAQ